MAGGSTGLYEYTGIAGRMIFPKDLDSFVRTYQIVKMDHQVPWQGLLFTEGVTAFSEAEAIGDRLDTER